MIILLFGKFSTCENAPCGAPVGQVEFQSSWRLPAHRVRGVN